MIQRILAPFLVLLTALLVACGGGGGDGGGDAPSFAGTYRVDTSVTSNSCNIEGLVPINGNMMITQDGRNVSTGNNDLPFNGSVDADNGGFKVTNTTVSNGVPVLTTITFRTTTAVSTYAVQISYAATAGNSTCSIVYSGAAVKN